MKFNWKVALMCVATLAMVACEKDKKDEGNGDGEKIFDYENPIEINDNSIADWDKLDQTKIAEAVAPNAPLWSALKKIRVYADSVCIYYMAVFDPAQMVSHTAVDVMHIYINADNSDATGGFWDLFAPAQKGDVDLMFEGPIWDDYGTQISYEPSVSYWSGPLNGEGWNWSETPVSNKLSASQFVGDSIIEGRLAIELIPYKFNKKAFEIGFDIQQNFDNVGLLPQINTPDGQLIGRAKKLYVEFDK